MYMYRSARTLKRTTLDPCKIYSESYSKLYTNFEFCEKTIIYIFLTHYIVMYADKNNFIKNIHVVVEDGTSEVQVHDIEQVIAKTCLEYYK